MVAAWLDKSSQHPPVHQESNRSNLDILENILQYRFSRTMTMLRVHSHSPAPSPSQCTWRTTISLMGLAVYQAGSAKGEAPPVVQFACGSATGVWLPPMLVPPTTDSTKDLHHPERHSGNVGKVAGFLGVPFAAPPVGRRGRWKPPAPPKCWGPEPFDASNRPTQCIQWRELGAGKESEDCLYLNVFAPAAALPASLNPTAAVNTSATVTGAIPSSGAGVAAGKLPVFFWIYGGDNTMGNTEIYGAVENLVTLYDGKAVVVAANYRLGAFGFLVRGCTCTGVFTAAVAGNARPSSHTFRCSLSLLSRPPVACIA
jgi:hypothetical protein